MKRKIPSSQFVTSKTDYVFCRFWHFYRNVDLKIKKGSEPPYATVNFSLRLCKKFRQATKASKNGSQYVEFKKVAELLNGKMV